MKKDSLQKNKKELQSEQTRKQIIETATKLFARKGFYGTSISDLTKAVGLTKGALYHHFEDKDALFFAVVESVQNTWEKAVANEVVSEKDSLAQISILFEKHADLLSKNEFMCLVMSNLMNEMESVNPKYSSILEDVYEEFVLFVEQIIKAGQSNGEIRPDLDPKLLSLNIVGILKGIGCYPKLKRTPIDRIALADSLKKVLLDGIKA